jgi:hypothetical protein
MGNGHRCYDFVPFSTILDRLSSSLRLPSDSWNDSTMGKGSNDAQAGKDDMNVNSREPPRAIQIA